MKQKVIVLKRERVELLQEAIRLGMVDLEYFDLETSLMEIYTHYIGTKVFLGHHQIKKDKKIICIQYMSESDDNVSYVHWDFKKGQPDDTKIVRFYIDRLNSRPNLIVIGQNHKAFDHKVLNHRAKILGLPPIETVVDIDTLTLSRGAFKAPSHRLDYRSKELGLGGKVKMEFDDWIAVDKGDKKALKKMCTYGCKDVSDLRAIFWDELPYYKTIAAPLEKVLLEVKKLKLGIPTQSLKDLMHTKKAVHQTKPFCPKCRKKKICATTVEVIKEHKKSTKYKCNNCTFKFTQHRS